MTNLTPSGTCTPQLTSPELQNIKIPIIPIEEQDKLTFNIEQKLKKQSEIKNQIATHRKKIEDLITDCCNNTP